MLKVSRINAGRLLATLACVCLAVSALAQVSVRSVKVHGSKDVVEVEVEASDRVVPETQVLTGPDRLVVDFPNAVPGSQLRNQSIDRGDVKDVRVGLFQAKPPITRVVLDLKSARSYQIFPYGRTVMIKVTGDASASIEAVPAAVYAQSAGRPALVTTNYASSAEPVTASASTPLQVSYRDGLLEIHANKATLSEVLYAIQQRTGADMSIPAGAEQERVVADIGPAPAAEVVAKLLNGSRFNFLILNSANDPRRLDRVILSPRTENTFVPPPQPQAQEVDTTTDEPPLPAPNQPAQVPDTAPPPPAPPQPPGGTVQ